jgi:hypothetical protein
MVVSAHLIGRAVVTDPKALTRPLVGSPVQMPIVQFSVLPLKLTYGMAVQAGIGGGSNGPSFSSATNASKNL